MILYINERLNQWADWCARGRRVVGLGYPSRSAFYRLAPVPSQALTPIPDEACWEIEQAVHRLEPGLIAVVDQFYRHAGTGDTHAKALRISRDTLYVRLHAAHVRIMEWLQVGDEDQPVQTCLTDSDRFDRKHIS